MGFLLHPEEPASPVLPPPLWRNRNFLLLWSGQTVSRLGSRVSEIALPLLVLALTRSPAQAGFIAAAQSLPYLLLRLPAGALVDRWDRKRVMILCDMARCLALGSIPLAYARGQLGVGQLYAVAVVAGLALVFFDAAELASLPLVVLDGQLTRAAGLNATAESVTYLVGRVSPVSSLAWRARSQPARLWPTSWTASRI